MHDTSHTARPPTRGERAETISLTRELERLAPAAAAAFDKSIDPLSSCDAATLAAHRAHLRRRVAELRSARPTAATGSLSGRCLNLHQAATLLNCDTRSAAAELDGLPRRLDLAGQAVYRAADIESFLVEKAAGRDGRRFL